ncbi:Hypothetical protein NGAL_HAMBI1146_59820 [Neorhizobium galegae bv. officinalis]|nr:Hypothetical protein NGAL_HAMBI1146_59820 [Neorhizobium galegae bv. officinalis]
MTALMKIPPPFSSEKVCGLVVRGYTMGAIRDGWVVVISDKFQKPAEELDDQLCVVKTMAGRILLRFVKVGRRAGRWDLLSVTGEPRLDEELAWAEPVLCIIPHTLTPTEINYLGEIPMGELLPSNRENISEADDA